MTGNTRVDRVVVSGRVVVDHVHYDRSDCSGEGGEGRVNQWPEDESTQGGEESWRQEGETRARMLSCKSWRHAASVTVAQPEEEIDGALEDKAKEKRLDRQKRSFGEIQNDQGARKT